MALQTFTASQVLTATQMNNLQANDYNWTVTAKTASYVLTAADKGTTITMSNAGATTITVNNSLFSAGDTLRIYNIGAGTCTITAGTATVNTAGSLALTQWGGGTLYFTSASAAIFFPGTVKTAPPYLEILMIAGGGGGGGGGGGAGGYKSSIAGEYSGGLTVLAPSTLGTTNVHIRRRRSYRCRWCN